MNPKYIITMIFVMAGITYLIRMLPMVLIKKKIESRFLKSFLYYVPYAVLGAMTFPAVFTSTASIYSALAGTIVAVFLSFREKNLLIVALSACLTVYIVEWILRMI